jgi:hypothetical protein
MEESKKDKKIETLKLQNEAVRAYYDYHGEDWDDIENEESLLTCGDTMPLFIWREVGDAEGDPREAARMTKGAYQELAAVQNRMTELIHDPAFKETNE